MSLSKLKDKWVEVVATCNEKGVPLPTIRDPKTKEGSVSLTLVFISFNLCVAGIVGKWSGALGGIDVSQALNLFMVCAGLYWGRRVGKSGDKDVSVEEKEAKN